MKGLLMHLFLLTGLLGLFCNAAFAISPPDSIPANESYKYFGADPSIAKAPAKNSSLFFYPNPTTDLVYFKQEVESVVIYNMLKKTVKRYTVSGAGSFIEVSDLSAGTYIIELKLQTKKVRFILIKI